MKPAFSEVTIIEVGPRDGFQNVKEFIETPHKEEIIRAMLSSGVKEMELTSFVSPKAIPQMADAADVCKAILGDSKGSFRDIALVPNLRGAQNAAASGIGSVSCVISATESHNQENVRRSIEESFEGLKSIAEEVPELDLRLDIAMSFGCPFEGKVPVEKVLSMIDRALTIGVKEIVLCDTIGIANPVQMGEFCKEVKRVYPDVKFALHLHDTRGMGLANMIAGMEAGFDRYETSIGGLGGCPFAPGAAGNIATEDAVNMLHEMGIATGIDLPQYLRAVDLVKQYITPNLTGRLSLVNMDCKAVVRFD